MTTDTEMTVKKPKVKKSEKAAAEGAETPVKEKKAKTADGSVKKKKRKADTADEPAAASPEEVRLYIHVAT